jgi:hypothetical protein
MASRQLSGCRGIRAAARFVEFFARKYFHCLIICLKLLQAAFFASDRVGARSFSFFRRTVRVASKNDDPGGEKRKGETPVGRP